MLDFKSLKLLPSILTVLKGKGYSRPTAIQAKSIPVLLAGNDLLGIAQTGTGKTASFSLPIIDRLGKRNDRPAEKQIRALILAPTRELATQIHKNISSYSSGLPITSAIVIGGVRKETQIEELKPGTDIIVATPGRLMDLMGGGHIRFDELEVFVLDEADMMLDYGFFEDVKTISAKLPTERQTVLFSATMPRQIEELAKSILREPIKVQVAPQSSTIATIDQFVYFVEEDNKLPLLGMLLEDESVERVLVFCKAKYGIVNVVDELNLHGISNGEIHSNRTQSQRDEALAEFSAGNIRVLVATDIAARGIDVDDVTHVINFNLPDDATYYVHRIGRTGRAGKNGVAISLCGERDLALLRNVQKIIKKEIPIVLDQPYHKKFAPLVKKTKRTGSAASLRERKRPSQAKRRAKNKFLDHL